MTWTLILLSFGRAFFQKWGCSSVGRAPALQAGGHRFDPVQLHHMKTTKGRKPFYFRFTNGKN
jgi:hypothetical protein